MITRSIEDKCISDLDGDGILWMPEEPTGQAVLVGQGFLQPAHVGRAVHFGTKASEQGITVLSYGHSDVALEDGVVRATFDLHRYTTEMKQAAEYLRSQPGVDRDRVGLFTFSMDTVVAMYLLSNNYDVNTETTFKSLGLVSPGAGWRHAYPDLDTDAQITNWLKENPNQDYFPLPLQTPPATLYVNKNCLEGPDGLKAADIFAALESGLTQSPLNVLIHVGEHEEVVKPEALTRLYESLGQKMPRASVTKTIIKGQSHLIRPRFSNPQMVDFFVRTL